MELLVRNYNLDTVDSSMCRNHLSVNWNGDLYDCDFNQQLDLRIADSGLGLFFVLEIIKILFTEYRADRNS
jgi:hypothetical protein